MMTDRQRRRIASPYCVGIRAIGKYIPNQVVTNAEIADRLPTTSAWIKEHIGVQTRHIAGAEEWSSDLGALALTDACGQLALDARAIDLVICGTYTPDHMLPNTAAAIMSKVGIDGTPGFDVNSGGCPGAVFALDVGAKYVASGQYPRTAVVLTDVSSKLFDPEDRTVGTIFGDAAACYLLEPTLHQPGVGSALLRSRASRYFSVYAARDARNDVNGTPKKSGFGDNFTTMRGREIWNFVAETIPNFVIEFLAKENLTPDDIDFFAVHQANINLVHLILRSLQQPLTKTVTNIARIGNTSGASVPLVLREAADSGQLRPGHLALLVAFGGGLNYGATLVRWCGPEDFVSLA
jgi:3-oxoacyl-[acyl-carrier-protein] synthase III